MTKTFKDLADALVITIAMLRELAEHPFDVDPDVARQTLILAKKLQEHAISQMARGICSECKGNGCIACNGDGWSL